MNPVIKALNFRHACKAFDPDRKIARNQIQTIMEAARLSPSSFGLEAWRFLVISSEDVKRKLRPACWNQPQITDASHVIVVLCRPDLADPADPYIRKNFQRRDLTEEAVQIYVDKYKNHMETEVFPRMSAYAWCSKQCYIALANIMTAAAAQGIDSCPIEGFEKDPAEKALGIDTDTYEISVIATLGFRLKDPPKKNRWPASQTIEYI
ncbi:NAD(P)H-dependent oxidoreductase [Desulfospira joergensenii]|uniref:NAD(P)H-dependent oxidoreductase n=1 Tax=Desulfospira joergensenii TaxID=53329 RepID=UPI0003B565A6|nr:NAD(P)H-dependent oxidoreductase [Desulfospira joergensenii]